MDQNPKVNPVVLGFFLLVIGAAAYRLYLTETKPGGTEWSGIGTDRNSKKKSKRRRK